LVVEGSHGKRDRSVGRGWRRPSGLRAEGAEHRGLCEPVSESCLNLSAGWRRAQLCGPQAKLKSCRPITLKKLGAAIGAAAQELQSARKMAFVGGHDLR